MEKPPSGNDEQSMQASFSESGSYEDRGGFMISARISASSQGRATVAKRKFEDMDVGIGDSITSLMSVRPRRDMWESTGQETHSGFQETASGDIHMTDASGTCTTNCTALDGIVEVNNPLQVLPQVNSDWIQQPHELVRTSGNSADLELVKLADTCKVAQSLSDTNQDRHGDFLMDYSSSEPIDDMATSTGEEGVDQTEASNDENPNLFSTDEEHEDTYLDACEIGFNGGNMELLEKGKEKEEDDYGGSSNQNISDVQDVTNMDIISEPYSDTRTSFITQSQSLSSESPRASSLEPVNGDRPLSGHRLQFFVKTFLDGPPLVLLASSTDTVESVYHQIHVKTGLPTNEQRLIYCGKQLQRDQTLAECNVTKDATLQLVGRMRSTALPQSWQLISDLVATIRNLSSLTISPEHRKMLQDKVCSQVKEFLKMASKSSPSEHMQVFQLTGAGATFALVMLLLSPIESNRRCAEECIKLFTSANDDYLPSNIHCYCAPILLEFCKLLAKSASDVDLYNICRSSLASLLDSIGVVHKTPYFNDAKASFFVQEFAPFVDELSVKLASNLRGAMKACALKDKTCTVLQQVKEGQDFTAFVIPLCKAMEECENGEDDELSSDFIDLDVDEVRPEAKYLRKDKRQAPTFNALKEEIGSQRWLRTVFNKLLDEVDSCFEAVEDVIDSSGQSNLDNHPFGWAPLLVVLKGLHAIGKLFDDRMQKLLAILDLHRSALNVLIGQSRWHDENFWLLDYGFLLDFESKKRLVMAMLPEPNDDHDERQEVVIARSQLLSESFECLAYVEPDLLHGGISVEFINEEATGPGVLREWFSLMCREIFNPQNALFLSCPNDRRRFFPNPASGVNPGHLTYFRFCGRFVALAFMHRVQIDVVFSKLFYKQLAGHTVNWEDVQDIDPELYFSCKNILGLDFDLFDPDALGLAFVTEVEELGSRKVVELCPGGKDMAVTSKNRLEYVTLLVERRFVTSVAEQVKCFAQGFSDLLVNFTLQQFFKALQHEDLDLMLYGNDRDISVSDWKAHTEYHDYTEEDVTINWFWQVVDVMTTEQRRRLLFFATSVSHLPVEGFSGLSSKFHIHRAFTDLSWLPTAHTCFFQLVLPPYSSLEMMHARLVTIIEGHIAEGFGFA
eukprot:TRINITY_DN1516_c0_g2_i1.p1 TRINITY_DN1516_c0_g2~~TRINITY_DN1516_c0_g2_i1.p1  ORF type:complete len:1132 (+),score=250.60 TRINITY_DN1516_c0_g2_i1:168-3563(+)